MLDDAKGELNGYSSVIVPQDGRPLCAASGTSTIRGVSEHSIFCCTSLDRHEKISRPESFDQCCLISHTFPLKISLRHSPTTITAIANRPEHDY